MAPTGFLGAGSFSLPTTIIGGEQLTSSPHLFSGYTCTKVVASADSASFVYRGDGIKTAAAGGGAGAMWYTIDLEPTNVDVGSLDMVIDPYRVGAATTGVYFLCYCSGCNENKGYLQIGNMGTGYTGDYSGTTQSMFKSTIIGGGALNS